MAAEISTPTIRLSTRRKTQPTKWVMKATKLTASSKAIKTQAIQFITSAQSSLRKSSNIISQKAMKS